MTLHRSGAGVSDDQVGVVAAHLARVFPGLEIEHIPEGDKIADLFQVIEGSKKQCQIRVRRTFYDRFAKPTDLDTALSGVKQRMQQAAPHPLELS